MNVFLCVSNISLARLFALVVVSVLLVAHLNVGRAAAISYTGVATPSTTAYGANIFAFEPDTPPTGNWTSTTTSLTEGRAAAYLMPVLSGTCDAAAVTSLIATINTTAIDLAMGTSQDLAGVDMRFVDTTDINLVAPALPLSSVLSGSHYIFGGPGGVNIGVRGITNPMITNTPQAIPGTVSIQLNTSGMTVADYKNLAISVHHDLLDGPFGFVNSVTTSQPVVQVQTNDAACHPITARNDTGKTSVGQVLQVPAVTGLLANDEGANLTVTGNTQPGHGAVTVQPDGSYVYTPNNGFIGEDTFTYTVTDAYGQTRTATVYITIDGSSEETLANTGTSYGPWTTGIAFTLLAVALALARNAKRRVVRYRYR